MTDAEKEIFGYASSLIGSAGLKLKKERTRSVINVREKTSPMDLVTDHDLAVEKYLVASILGKYPGHSIISEESPARMGAGAGGYTWIIDPIDGTVNYYRFGRNYAISLALYKKEEPVFGLIYDVADAQIFSAGDGEGAFLNGSPLPEPPDDRSGLKQSVVALSFRTMQELVGLGMDVLGLLSRVQAHRYLGCASLELCKVANGEYDLFISSNVYEWDVAAARIFLEQRGGYLLCGNHDAGCAYPGRLLVAAFRSLPVWEEAFRLFPRCLRDKFAAPVCLAPD
ncbi:inositol monophosphatase family protein [Candidatus Formimonas warabiya]|uniref:Inositol monophosphatase n=1 Tax=Formimonas warabiya TaxID=1761012 RepID=A0A3G1KW19_FORW1|nr:inositol monophosphatase [Candidatus Formimonas warabiya]ATW26646.1 hypothetical protein DCMF_19495 [Candidatus Formimonas warabiya]